MEKRRFRVITLFLDIIILAISFLAMVWVKPASLRHYLPSHSLFFAILAVIWLIVSLVNGKMPRGKIINFSSLFNRVISSNIISLAITALLMYSFREYTYSRTIVLGTALVATILELIIGSVYIAYKKASLQDYEDYEKYKSYRKPSEYDLVSEINGNHTETIVEVHPDIISAIENESGPEMTEAIINMKGPKLTDRTAVLSTTTILNITSLHAKKYEYIINLHRINDIKKLDDFIDAVNRKLEDKGYFFCCVETKDQRKKRILKKYWPVLNYIYYFFDFIVKRVLPKLKITRPLYFTLTHGNNAVITGRKRWGVSSREGSG